MLKKEISLRNTFIILLFLKCFSSFADTESYARPISIGEPLLKWNKSHVIVCWLDQNRIPTEQFSDYQLEKIGHLEITLIQLSTSKKKMIQDFIQTEFDQSKTGISFTGWNSCNNTPKPDAILLVGEGFHFPDTPGGRASLGRGHFSQDFIRLDDDKLSFLYFNITPTAITPKLDIDDYLKNLSLHEFGHLAGLRHEHIRDEAKRDPLCRFTGITPGGERVYSQTRYYSKYDPVSIMNYCFNDFIEKKAGKVFYVSSKYDEKLWAEYFDRYIFANKQVDPALLNDDSIISQKLVNGVIELKVRIGLSKQDIHTLKCMYMHTDKECHTN